MVPGAILGWCLETSACLGRCQTGGEAADEARSRLWFEDEARNEGNQDSRIRPYQCSAHSAAGYVLRTQTSDGQAFLIKFVGTGPA